MKLTGENQSTLRKTCPSATLSITNPTWTDPGSNPGLRSERPGTNRLSHGTAKNNNLLLPYMQTYRMKSTHVINVMAAIHLCYNISKYPDFPSNTNSLL
jgi:hypothetical protein